MILTVTPNPALDLTWHADIVRPGHTHRVDAGIARAGGKGLNVARVLTAQGIEVTALTTIGGSTGAQLRADLEVSGITCELVPVAAETRRSIAIVDECAGEVSVFNEYGTAPADIESATFWTAAARLGADAAVVTVNGSMPPGADPAVISRIVSAVQRAGVPVLVDSSGAGLRAAATAGARALKPNHEELVEVTGEADPLTAARALLANGTAVVVASLGGEGLIVAHRDGRAVRARFPEVIHGNPTGAGDAVAAAITVSLAADPAASFPDGLGALARRCAAWGAAAVAMPLAGDLDPTIAAREADVLITELED